MNLSFRSRLQELFGSDRLALLTNDRQWTYRELGLASRGYGHALRQAAAKTAPVLLTQSTESAALFLGALQTCQRVVPLGVNLLLRDLKRFEALLARDGLFVTRGDWEQLRRRFRNTSVQVRIVEPASAQSLELTSAATDITELVFHTSSSSTGETKGVLVSTDYLPAFFAWCVECFGLTENDRSLWASPMHFDMSTLDVLLPLYLGAAVVVPGPGELFYADRFIRLLTNQKVSMVHSVPSLWHGVATVTSATPAIPASLKVILVAGDILPNHFLKRLKTGAPSARIFNVYGQTEANSYLAHEINSVDDASFPFRLGTTESYATVSVQGDSGLNGDGFGQLVVRGPNVALGYLANDYMTLRPLPSAGENRSFQTGDLVRIGDGMVELFGRVGAEVDANGLVEHELNLRTRCNAIEGVVQSVITIKAGRPVLVFEPESHTDIPRLIQAIEAVVPQGVRVYARTYLPMNYNGKVDLRLLADSLPA